jgi:hypothetical protein
MLARLLALLVVVGCASESLADGVCCTGCGGTCSITTAAACAQSGGTFLGNGSTCTPTSCIAHACCTGCERGCYVTFPESKDDSPWVQR